MPKPNSIEWFIQKYGPIDGPLRKDQWQQNQRSGREKHKKSFPQRMKSNKLFKQTFGDDFEFTSVQLHEINTFFVEFPKYDRGLCDVMPRLIVYIKNNRIDWINIEYELRKYNSNTLSWYQTLYGESEGYDRYYAFKLDRVNTLPSNITYWLNKGYDIDTAKHKVSESQRAKSNGSNGSYKSKRTVEYWIGRGLDITDATAMVSSEQRRDLEFFLSTHGTIYGLIRYYESIQKRKQSWDKDKRIAHGELTAPRKFNPDGQEMQAINGFITYNNIDESCCMFGPPNKQFYQYIPNLGYRRYDLAVFTDSSKNKLKYVLEFHGPSHINFSDYDITLENKRVLLNGCKVKWCDMTYGEMYNNDFLKRMHILEKFQDVEYIVMWVDDLKQKRFDINALSKSKK